MATESERKRFHLEDIIRQISEETVSTATSGITSISSGELFGKEDICGKDKRDFEEDSSDGIKSVESLSEEENLNDEVIVQSKISPRCDVCGLLHFKSYRCVTRVSSPAYIRQAFDDNYHKLRVCRKCLTSKENCIENVAISNLTRYSDKIRQMKIPLGMTSNRRTKPFELVVRNLQHIKFSDFHRPDDLECFEEFDSYSSIVDNTSQTSRKTLLQRFHMDDPIQKNLFLKELNLCSTEMLKNVSRKEEISDRPNGNIKMEKSQPMHKDINPVFNHSEDVRSLYHVTAKNVVSSNIPEKKLGEGAVKCVNHDLVVSTKRAWKPNKNMIISVKLEILV
ncbi:uncharacterized protein LOC124446964 isoform X2 [Xenia sp. Carnegie-2017]|uniref:uncharacterized protein LOC124446964 isoform X2 n=1 Tax=Xenia sp. Carnegie-2017 TaxID=2897299 RepID=UPI001F042633|nr:uncharacterized protein LOC124446964 isoform X2 [Xenia sp. Carnegie-2017]